MNIWLVILVTIVSVSLVLYLLVVVLGVKSDKLFGPPLMTAIIVVLLAGLSYYLLWDKSIYVVIKSGESVLHKSSIAFNDEVWQKDDVFMFRSKTRGIDGIDFRQQIREFLAGDELELCRDYTSKATGSGRYKSTEAIITICVNKKGLRWYF